MAIDDVSRVLGPLYYESKLKSVKNSCIYIIGGVLLTIQLQGRMGVTRGRLYRVMSIPGS